MTVINYFTSTMKKVILGSFVFLSSLMVFPFGVSAQMMRRFNYGNTGQVYGNGSNMMGWGVNADRQAGFLFWIFMIYRAAIAVLFLIILVLIVKLLWKKLELMDGEEKRKR